MDTLLEQGIELMLIGMGVVFSFLILLVILTTLMSSIINRFFPEASSAAAPAAQPLSSMSTPVDAVTLRVIEDAVRQHRARTGRG